MLEEIKFARIADVAGRGATGRSVPMSSISTRLPAKRECVAVVPRAARDQFLVLASGN
jgi:hypothetical protein